MPVEAPTRHRLAVLLPVTSKSAASSLHSASKDTLDSVLGGLRDVAASLRSSSSSCLVIVGIDSDDDLLLRKDAELKDVFTMVGVQAIILLFSEADRAAHGQGALCHLWGLMGKAAVKEGCSLAVLLGDDTKLQPAGWADTVLSQFTDHPQLMLLLLKDEADPGFPSFPVLRIDRHLEVFGSLLPACFVNQGGDPYLAALYRRWKGCVSMLPGVSVVNSIGGVQRADQLYQEPRYTRCPVSKQRMLEELQHGTTILEAAVATEPAWEGAGGSISRLQRQLAVDVLVPTARVDLDLLEGIADAVLGKSSPPGADLTLILVVDKPSCELSERQALWLQQLQARWLHRVRIRVNEENLGASATRNRALEESLAEYIIFWDDDIKPSSDCLAAYVEAFQKHPQARGFAGPSIISKDPSCLWCCAVHQSDVLFFWDAAADWRLAEVMPWAVTANVALINTPDVFDLRFPKTGGGEDIDYCLKVTGGQLVPVPQASVHHPLWNGGRRCYNRFFGWAWGDGALILMYPHLTFLSAPNSAELCCALLLLSAATTAITLLLWSVVQASRLLDTSSFASVGLAAGVTWRASTALLAAALAYKAADLVLDVVRAFSAKRVARHPCSSRWLRAAASAEASLIKTWSECGRLWGLIRRGEMAQGFLRRFDWFCGLDAGIVVGEQRWAAWRCLVCTAIAVVAAAAVVG